MRKISKILALIGLLTPASANALGVGEIKLHSALNQVLEAEIPLITSGSESASEIRVSLASATAFANAGIERPYHLSSLRFAPVIENGRVVVKVSSKDIIREPFLNFLLEVTWQIGRTLREFTVLLDPPSTFDQTVITATRMPGVQSTTLIKPHYSVDHPSNSGFRSKPSTPTQRETAKVYKAGNFVRSKVNEPLWGLAKRLNTDPSVSREQMMMALYEANPRVFFKNNINALKPGQRLKVPSREDVLKISRREALSGFKSQNDQWRGLVASSAGKKAASPYSKGKEASARTASTESTNKLELVSAAAREQVARTSTDSSQSAPLDKQETAPGVVDSVRHEIAELRSRLKEAEDQLNRLQQMLTLKDRELSTVQSGQIRSENPTEKKIDSEVDKPAMEASKPTASGAGSAENTVAPAEIAPKAEDQSGSKDRQLEPVATNQEAILVEDLADESVTPAQSKVTEKTPELIESKPVLAVSPKPAQTAVVTPEPDDLFSELLSEPYYLALGSSAAVVVGMLGWAKVRRRNRIMMAHTESFLASTHSDSEEVDKDTNPRILQTTIPNDGVSVVESSFLSEFTPSDFDAVETDHKDVDPVSEADVYLAYGRYQQAEDLIRNAIENYPDRDECKLKLLEIHFASEDRNAFEAYARELEAFKHEKPKFWAKVVEMGREICPDIPLFGPGNTAGQTRSKNNFAKTDFGDEDAVGVDLRKTEIKTGESGFDSDDLDFEMADDLDEEEQFGGFGSYPAGEEDSFAFGDDGNAAENLIEFDRFNEDAPFDFSRGLEKRESEAHRELGLEDNLETIEFEDAGLGNSVESMDEAVSDEGSEFADLTDMDEIETKLDLAKAFFELDDQESARGILSEILIEGNDEQKSEARVLVDLLEHKV